jgi:hypothetical protein
MVSAASEGSRISQRVDFETRQYFGICPDGFASASNNGASRPGCRIHAQTADLIGTPRPAQAYYKQRHNFACGSASEREEAARSRELPLED